MAEDLFTEGPHDADLPDDDVGAVRIDCDGCVMRQIACGDCVVTVLLGQPPVAWDDEEQRAMSVLADSGLVPPLRLVRGDGQGMRPTRGYPRHRGSAAG